MQFAQPLWLLIGAIACACLAWSYRRFDLRQRSALAQFASTRLVQKLTTSVSPLRRRVKRGLYLLGVALLFATLARPQAGFTWQETHRKGLEILFAVDTSKSMLAQDVKPDRLTRAKMAITDLVTKLNGDGVGLVAFAGDAFLQCPVTLDYEAFRESLEALDVNVIPRPGTDIAAAIQEAQAVFKTRTAAEKILVLVTDGEDLGGEALTAAQTAGRDGVKIFTLGVGGTAGELIPVPNEHGGTDFARDDKGELVKSHLDAAMLTKIAEATGGMYQPLGAQGEGLETIYNKGLAAFTRHDLSARQTKVPIERFYWPLGAALLCFLGEMLIGNRRRLRAQPSVAPLPARRKLPRGLRPATAAVALLSGALAAHANVPQQAEQDFHKGEFAKAQQEYAASAAKDPANAALHFNAGSAAYRTGDYAQAAQAFGNSLKTDQVPLQQSAYYNLGNTQYRLGQKSEKEKPQEAIKTWEDAVKSYNAALQITATDAQAKHNRDFVQSKIDQLKKQEEQKKQDQQKQDQKDQQKQDQKIKQKQDQKSQPQNQSGQDKKDQQGGQGQQGEPKDQKDSGDQKSNPKDGKGDAHGSAEEGRSQTRREAGRTKRRLIQANNRKASRSRTRRRTARNSRSRKPASKQAQPKTGEKTGQATQPKPLNAEKKPEQGKAESAAGESAKDEPATAAAEERREPGQMTREEAKGLLDALKGDERKLPAVSQRGRAGLAPNDRKPLQDW